MEEFHREVAGLTGRAQDEDGLVTVTYAAEGLRDLDLHPKAMRLSSGELAERIRLTVHEAAKDLQEQVDAAMSRAFGEENNPMRLLGDPEAALGRVREAEAAYDRTFEDVMGELDRIRRRLEL
ncbi:YbaB/EbfC family nucleoid-associated protein [Streptosporangium sp. NPDC051022]|uniref:YbaB/EbfC family nucleoid-associated protein n=1 Tax=Streptosporangium sp. NPDC051022 TaxID=3155752 RepID=UPI0034405A70